MRWGLGSGPDSASKGAVETSAAALLRTIGFLAQWPLACRIRSDHHMSPCSCSPWGVVTGVLGCTVATVCFFAVVVAASACIVGCKFLPLRWLWFSFRWRFLIGGWCWLLLVGGWVGALLVGCCWLVSAVLRCWLVCTFTLALFMRWGSAVVLAVPPKVRWKPALPHFFALLASRHSSHWLAASEVTIGCDHYALLVVSSCLFAGYCLVSGGDS